MQQNAERTAAADYDGSNRLGHFRAMKRRSRRETINIGSGVYEILPGAIEETASEKEAAREKRTLSKARK